MGDDPKKPKQPSILELIHGEEDHVIQPIVRPEKGEGSSNLERQFLRFHELNPHVYNMIVKIAFELKRRGIKKTGISMIFERMRWLWALQTRGDDYKLNNSYRAFYARKVMAENPELDGMFQTRIQKHKKDPDAE